MKVVFNINYPVAWAPGGGGLTLFEMKNALKKCGVETGWMRNEDTSLSADILHSWGHCHDALLDIAHNKGVKVVADIQNGTAIQDYRPFRLMIRRYLDQFAKGMLGYKRYCSVLNRGMYSKADALISNNPAYLEYVCRVFNVPVSKTHAIWRGVRDPFFEINGLKKKEHLVCVGSILPLKNQVLLARIAKEEKVPIKFIGPPHPESESYVREFENAVDGRYVTWERGIIDSEELAQRVGESMGLVLLSSYESYGNVIMEALAAKVPVLASSLFSLQSIYGNDIQYVSTPLDAHVAPALTAFYDQSCRMGGTVAPAQIKPLRWSQVAQKVIEVYKECGVNP
ncbi:glycosyltransferase family 4 protein [Tichowtungia aerotolerans]|uniref:Glycosyl transferase family 1 domain-containing protein n=1 Tax=Tichowtungia aerotolerans TaxID=2697043 RepID=A0A6P1M6I6_9BACT|nr:glycosyltransferase family 4 protein [Tichowtungia aerotolerans]QHI70190.1 hypothetical protein GT409_12315 [Tichowtungia aerotolerans]